VAERPSVPGGTQLHLQASLLEPLRGGPFWRAIQLHRAVRPRRGEEGLCHMPKRGLTGAGIPASKDRILRPSGHAVSFRSCFRHAAETIPTAPASVYLSRGKADPCLGSRTGLLRPAPEPPSRVPTFEVYTGERQTPVCDVRLDLPRGRSGYPPALPVFLLPSFLNEGEADPCWRRVPPLPP